MMLELLTVIIGVAVGTLLAITVLVALAIQKPQFAKRCIRSFVIIVKEVIEDIIDCL